MSYRVIELEEDVFMELDRKQTEQICGGLTSFELSEDAIHQAAEVIEKYKDDDCIVIWRDPNTFDEPWSVDHYICYREGDELPDYLRYSPPLIEFG